jgi:hypothetical protein
LAKNDADSNESYTSVGSWDTKTTRTSQGYSRFAEVTVEYRTNAIDAGSLTLALEHVFEGDDDQTEEASYVARKEVTVRVSQGS